MTPYKLEMLHKNNHPTSHFFDDDTLKFFGERKSEMRVLQKTEIVKGYSGTHECYVLSSKQHKHPSGPRRVYHYFDVKTFEVVIKAE